MYGQILKIGNARFRFNEAALSAFVEEARLREGGGVPSDHAPRGGVQPLLKEMRDLYRAYQASDSIDVLVQLKSRLEEASVTYCSHALAQEVLSINSCLPYERRIPRDR